jgi:hypothetical protein
LTFSHSTDITRISDCRMLPANLLNEGIDDDFTR